MTAGLPVAVCPFAISDRTGTIEMVLSNEKEDWAVGAHHVVSSSHQGAKLLDLPDNDFLRGEEITVNCMTLDDFIDSRHITEIDFCKIDVEGHELNIISGYSWRVKPKFLKIEHKHQSGGQLDPILLSQGYSLFVEQDDIYAVL